MEVKRLPQSPVGQSVDPSNQPSHQDHKQGDKSKKNLKKGQTATSQTTEAKAPETNAEWESSDLSRQPIDSETVVELLNHPTPPSKAHYPGPKPPPAPDSKLNKKY